MWPSSGWPRGCFGGPGPRRAGADVILLEGDRLPRYKACGGGLVRRALRAMAVDVGEVIERRCYAVEIVAASSGVRLRVERPEPVVALTMRDELDNRLDLRRREVRRPRPGQLWGSGRPPVSRPSGAGDDGGQGERPLRGGCRWSFELCRAVQRSAG
jgi:hypothetical protein